MRPDRPSPRRPALHTALPCPGSPSPARALPGFLPKCRAVLHHPGAGCSPTAWSEPAVSRKGRSPILFSAVPKLLVTCRDCKMCGEPRAASRQLRELGSLFPPFYDHQCQRTPQGCLLLTERLSQARVQSSPLRQTFSTLKA